MCSPVRRCSRSPPIRPGRTKVSEGEADRAQVAFQFALDAVIEDARVRIGTGRRIQHEHRGALRAGGACQRHRVVVIDAIERLARAGLFHRAAQGADGRFHARCGPVLQALEIDDLVAQFGMDLRQRPARDRHYAGTARIGQQLLQNMSTDQPGGPCQQHIHQTAPAISVRPRRRYVRCWRYDRAPLPARSASAPAPSIRCRRPPRGRHGVRCRPVRANVRRASPAA